MSFANSFDGDHMNDNLLFTPGQRESNPEIQSTNKDSKKKES